MSLIHIDAADEEDSVDLGGRRIIKKKKTNTRKKRKKKTDNTIDTKSQEAPEAERQTSRDMYKKL